MIVFKRERGENFYLLPLLLRQKRCVSGYRQTRRSEIARVFRQCEKEENIVQIAGMYHGIKWDPTMWSAQIIGGQLVIGCQSFTLAETQQLRRWALAKRKRKS